jgi:hypothetical protein
MSPLLVLQARAEARAMLFLACELDLDEALAPLEDYAIENEITDEGFAIIRAAFKEVIEL